MSLSAYAPQHAACAYFFLCPGLAYGILTSRMPALKEQTGANEAQIGLLLLCLIIVLEVAISLVVRGINSYLMPVALGAILPLWVALVVSIVALGAAGIGLITTDTMREEILRQDEQLKKDVSAMRSLQSKTRMLVGQCEDAAFAAELSKLAEAMQYSDPVSSEALQEIEFELSQLVDELQKAVLDQEFAAAKVLEKKVMDTLAERNQLCKLNK